MRNRTLAWVLSASMVLTGAPPLQAGGNLETINLNNATPAPAPATDLVVDLVGIRWDARTLPVQYRVNSTLDPIPNPLGAAFLTLKAATAALQASLELWNEIPTSFIDMTIVGTVPNAGQRGFDMKNEVTFRTTASFGAIAFSPSVSLIADATLTHGDDIDGDGDSDVSSAIATAADVDGDQDIEFPAGNYAAGTILDNDVAFNTKPLNAGNTAGSAAGLRFTVGDAALDTQVFSVDLMCVAVHEFGHSFGLAHSLENQNSVTDGHGATMFPFIDTGDPDAEREQRTPDTDDTAWASYLYPEGSAASGPGALQAGDVPFASAYGLITGEAVHGRTGQQLLGGNVFTVDRATKRRMVSAFTGASRLRFRPSTGQLSILPAALGIVDGRYTIPVPRGTYDVGIENLDGQPATSGNINLTPQVGAAYGHQDFSEEYFNNNKEGSFEKRSGQAKSVGVHNGRVTAGVNIVTNDTLHVNNFGNQNITGFTNAAAGRLYAVRVPSSQVSAAIAAVGGRASLLAANIGTNIADASVSVQFAEALLTTATADATGAITSVNFAEPLEREAPFNADQNDMTAWHFKNPHQLGGRIEAMVAGGAIENLFIIVRVPSAPFPGVSNFPPLISLDGPTNNPAAPNDVPNFGLSYQSDDGGVTWTKRADFNFRFGLVFAPRVP